VHVWRDRRQRNNNILWQFVLSRNYNMQYLFIRQCLLDTRRRRPAARRRCMISYYGRRRFSRLYFCIFRPGIRYEKKPFKKFSMVLRSPISYRHYNNVYVHTILCDIQHRTNTVIITRSYTNDLRLAQLIVYAEAAVLKHDFIFLPKPTFFIHLTCAQYISHWRSAASLVSSFYGLFF